MTRNEAVLKLLSPKKSGESARKIPPRPGARATATPADASATAVRIGLKGANPASEVEASNVQPGQSNYLIGNDPSRWRRGARHYTKVKYRAVYRGIDLVYHGNQTQLEQDFVLSPGADPKQIDLRIEGADKLSLNADGDLVVATGNGNLLLRRPTAYQVVNGERALVASNFVLRGTGTVGVQVAAYDHQRALVVDPVLDYATCLGGSFSGSGYGDQGLAIAADSQGNAYITGIAQSADFPTTSGVLMPNPPNTRGSSFVTKLAPGGGSLVFSTFLGGTGANGTAGLDGVPDQAAGIAVDSTGDVYVAGSTGSPDFPVTTTAFQTQDLASGITVFLAKLDPTGANLLYSTFLGGTVAQYCYGLAVDPNGNMYVTGTTDSTDFPITAASALQTTNNAAKFYTAFVSRIDPTLTGTASLVFSTYLGGSSGEGGSAIAVDANANAYVTGSTTSTDFPVQNAYQSTFSGTGSNWVARINTNPSSASLVYSTFFSGTETVSASNPDGLGDSTQTIDADNNFNVYVAGMAETPDFPTTTGAYQTSQPSKTSPGAPSVFAARFDTSKSGAASLLYSTYIGGSGIDFDEAIRADASGDVFLAGYTASPNFPVTFGAPQGTLTGGTNVFVSELNPAGAKLLFSTYYGGNCQDTARAIALDSLTAPSVYVTGSTCSYNFPTTPNAFQVKPKGTLTGFVLQMSPAAAQGVFALPTALSFGTVTENTTSTAQTVTVTNNTSSTINNLALSFTGTNAGDFAQTTTCGSTLAAGANCTVSVTFKPSTAAAESATLVVADSDSGSPHNVALTGTGQAAASPDFSLSVTPAQGTVTAGSSAQFTVTVTSVAGFSSAVSLSCSGEPTGSTCSLGSSSVTPAANSSGTTSATVTTTARTFVIPRAVPREPSPWIWPCTMVSIILVFVVGQVLTKRTGKRLVWAFALLFMAILAGCSGLGDKKTSGSGGTPAGTYTLTIKGTSGSLSHSATYAMTVN